MEHEARQRTVGTDVGSLTRITAEWLTMHQMCRALPLVGISTRPYGKEKWILCT